MKIYITDYYIRMFEYNIDIGITKESIIYIKLLGFKYDIYSKQLIIKNICYDIPLIIYDSFLFEKHIQGLKYNKKFQYGKFIISRFDRSKCFNKNTENITSTTYYSTKNNIIINRYVFFIY